MKTFSIEQAAENERCWTHEQYKRKNTDGEKNNHYDWTRREINFKVMLDSEGKTEIRSLRPQDGLKPTLHAKLQERLDFLGHKAYKAGARNNPFTCVDIVIGGDQSRMREMAFGDQKVAFDLSEDNSGIKRMQEIEEWATDTYEFAREQWGDENIIGMEVHLDESTPHAHVLIVPTAMRKQRGRKSKDKDKPKEETLKVSFSGCWGDNELERSEYTSKLHTVFYEKVGTKYGLERGDVIASLPEEERLERVHKNKRQLEAERQSKENVIKAQQTLAEKEFEISALNTKVSELEEDERNLEKDINEKMSISAGLDSEISTKQEKLETLSSDVEESVMKHSELQHQLEVISDSLFLAQSKAEGAVKNTWKGVLKAGEGVLKVGEAIGKGVLKAGEGVGKGLYWIGKGYGQMCIYAIPFTAKKKVDQAVAERNKALAEKCEAKGEAKIEREARQNADRVAQEAISEKNRYINRYSTEIALVDDKDNVIERLRKDNAKLAGLIEDASTIGLTAMQTLQLYRGEKLEVDVLTLKDYPDSPINPENTPTWSLRFVQELQIFHNRVWKTTKDWVRMYSRKIRERLRKPESPEIGKGRGIN